MMGSVQRLPWLISLAFALIPSTLAWTMMTNSEMSRHDFFVSSSQILLTSTTMPPRDVGDGLDLLQPAQLRAEDVVFPLSMEGLWTCQRVVKSVEGDAFAAETVWRALGGQGKKITDPEQFSTRFIPLQNYTVVDRSYEIKSRTGSDQVVWQQPNLLQYDKIQLSVLRRIVEVPNDQGFGYQEFVAIQDGIFQRAAFVKRRYRRAYDESGNRVVEGLEICKTFRVLDGVAGIEFPTSTTKSQITLSRPS